MERQLSGRLLLLLLLQLAQASETSGWDDQQMGQSTSPRTSHNSVLQTSSTRATMGMTTILATASTVITNTGTAAYVRTPTNATQEGRITTTSTSVTTSRQDTASSTTTSKTHIGTTQSTPTQPMEAANTTGRRITDEDTRLETKATLVTSTLVSTAGENTNSSTTKMASDRVNGTIKATPTASTTIPGTEKETTQPTATVSSLLKSPEGIFPIAPTISAAAKAADSVVATSPKTPGEIPLYSMWTSIHAGTNGPAKTIMSETNPTSVPLTTITTTRKDVFPSTAKKSSRLETTKATPLISMTVTEVLNETADMITTYPKEITSNAGTVLMTMSETKAMTTVPATADTMKDTIFSVATMSSRPKSQGGAAAQAPTSSMKLTANAGLDIRHTVSSKITTTLPTAPRAGSSGTNLSPIMSVANSSLPSMSRPCASDEYPSASLGRGCMCNSSYYAHSEVNNVTVALSCRPSEMEVSLNQCFLETHGWVQGYALFPGCSGINEIVHGWRVITFVVKRNESTCGLRLSTNISHALYSLNAQLPPASYGSKPSNSSTDISVTCAYPLVVNVSQKGPPKVAPSRSSIAWNLPRERNKEFNALFSLHSPFFHFPRHINISVTGTGNSIITLSIFTDPQYSSLHMDQPVALHTPLYVAIEATNADPERFVLVANAFFASTSASGTSAPETTYYFVKYSCPVSERLLTQPSTNGVSLKVKLAFRAFRFFTSNNLYYHSHVTLCDKQGNSSCQPNCTTISQKQRNLVELEHQNKAESSWLTYGPIQFQGSNSTIQLKSVSACCLSGIVLGTGGYNTLWCQGATGIIPTLPLAQTCPNHQSPIFLLPCNASI
ncbi:uncharacterized protein [Petaurus breviceps papuanus]|uniref:uncharacterized protein n=1 Tax=Petaurus breviceps papuanus TaxID=3040969 RepID=UPI0036DE503D